MGLGYIRTLEDIRQVAIGADRDGTPITVQDVAHVTLGPDMRRGAVDFVEKPFKDAQLIESVRRALAMHIRRPGSDAEAGVIRARAAGLSARERDVLMAVVDGKSSKIIARELSIAIKTVEAHRARIMVKLGVNSLAALVRLVVQYGLLQMPDR